MIAASAYLRNLYWVYSETRVTPFSMWHASPSERFSTGKPTLVCYARINLLGGYSVTLSHSSYQGERYSLGAITERVRRVQRMGFHINTNLPDGFNDSMCTVKACVVILLYTSWRNIHDVYSVMQTSGVPSASTKTMYSTRQSLHILFQQHAFLIFQNTVSITFSADSCVRKFFSFSDLEWLHSILMIVLAKHYYCNNSNIGESNGSYGVRQVAKRALPYPGMQKYE